MNENPTVPPPHSPEPRSSAPTPPPPDRTWEILCHLSALSGFLIPLGNLVGPLAIWLVKKDQSAAVDYHGKESLNFQISMFVYLVVAGISIFFLVGFVLVPLVLVLNVILTIVAAIKASNGVHYRYPLTFRLVT